MRKEAISKSAHLQSKMIEQRQGKGEVIEDESNKKEGVGLAM